MEIKNRPGIFHVTIACVYSAAPELLLQLFGNMVVLECHYSVMTGTIEYKALSPLFEEVNQGDTIPFYQLKADVIYDHNLDPPLVAFTASQITEEEARDLNCRFNGFSKKLTGLVTMP